MQGIFRTAFAGISVGLAARAIVRATVEQEKQMALLTNAVKQNSGAVGYNVDQLAEQASALQRVTTFGDEAVMGVGKRRWMRLRDHPFPRPCASGKRTGHLHRW
jgi:hypothetical protein